ncbi:MAG: phosphoribosyl-ATP diphosphatase [Actinomycetes bacterium]|jgi:phosphoribosyl-ATP pyrophosphohydrolase|nr:phosphoribosyl-ATP diphosphatase [Actinomycetes bacterium]
MNTENSQNQSLGATVDQLCAIIRGRRDGDPETSYTARLLTGDEDKLLKKIGEEATEVVMAAKDRDHDHLRYEVVDLLYHTLVCCERWGVTPDEIARETRSRFK